MSKDPLRGKELTLIMRYETMGSETHMFHIS
jgi:hypothetical protein